MKQMDSRQNDRDGQVVQMGRTEGQDGRGDEARFGELLTFSSYRRSAHVLQLHTNLDFRRPN